jgi:UDP-N-acetylglucosamine:LPS N-acetylglucosamine transferase
MMIKDSEVKEKLLSALLELAGDNNKQQQLKNNIGQLGVTDADTRIAEEIFKILN